MIDTILHRLKSSAVILLEGVAIAIGATIITVVLLAPYGVFGLARWTFYRLVGAWTDQQ